MCVGCWFGTCCQAQPRSDPEYVWFSLQVKFNSFELDSEVGRLVLEFESILAKLWQIYEKMSKITLKSHFKAKWDLFWLKLPELGQKRFKFQNSSVKCQDYSQFMILNSTVGSTCKLFKILHWEYSWGVLPQQWYSTSRISPKSTLGVFEVTSPGVTNVPNAIF